LLEEQPSQIDFENLLSIDLMKLLAAGVRRIYLEDEGHLIGRRYLPQKLGACMKEAPMLVVEQSLDQRIDVVLADYITDLGNRFAIAHGDDGPRLHNEKLQDDLHRIRKRLGPERHQTVSAALDAAFASQRNNGDVSLHRDWIAALLTDYYDPMYEYQLGKRSGNILFRGTRQEVVARAAELA
jgi:tRNA 2-selenouridine synthase